MSDDEREQDDDVLPPIAPPLFPGGVGATNAPPVPPVIPPVEKPEDDEAEG